MDNNGLEKQNRRWNFSGRNGRAVLFLLQETAVVLFAVSLAFASREISRMQLPSAGILRQGTVFERTDIFQNLVRERLDSLVENSILKSNFERRDKFYGRKIVDLAEYVEEGRISGQQKRSVGYYLEDLIRWSRKGLKYTYVDPEQSGALSAVPAMPAEFAGESQDTGLAADIDLEEEYAPVRGRKLFDYTGDLYEKEDLLSLLEKALVRIREDVQVYQGITEEAENRRTNVRYYIENFAEENTYTNFPAGSFRENDTIKTYGRYIILDSRRMEYESNMRVTDAYLYQLLTSYADELKGNYYLELGIDTAYPEVDSFSAARDTYAAHRPRIRAMEIAVVLFFLLSLILLLLLTAGAGQEIPGEEGEVRLNGLDKVKTEIAALFFSGVCVAGVYYLSGFVFSDGVSDGVALSVTGASAAALDLVFLTGCLSLARRMKAGTLYEDSLLRWFLDKCRYIVREDGIFSLGISPVLRLILQFSLFVGTNILLVYLGDQEYDSRYYIAAGLLDFGVLIYLINGEVQRNRIYRGVREMRYGNPDAGIDTAGMNRENASLGEAINVMSEGLQEAMESSIRNEKLKADLITNVSHDIKTPLTSIINYVDLLKRTNLTDEHAREYIQVLEQKSARLKTLTEDLVEASKITSGNITLDMETLDFCLLISQMEGEVSDRFAGAGLTLVTVLPDGEALISADGRRLFRVLDNLYGNVAKYAMPDTRVYADLKREAGQAVFSLKNVSRQQLNIDASQLTERFIRGDMSRSGEGSGLGLSIAQSLTELMGGKFEIYLDGDLFKVTISFRLVV